MVLQRKGRQQPGQGQPPLDETTKTRWRKQAIDWLKVDQSA
jgi:hypothetical protein